MKRTTTDHFPDTANVATAYTALADGTPYHVSRPMPEDGRMLEGAAAIQSNLRDLLTFYKHFMITAEEQASHKPSSSPLKYIPMLLNTHIPLEPEPSPLERSYGLGWIETELPGSLGMVGLNAMYVEKMPVVGKGLAKPQLCTYHQGSLVSFLSSIHLLPDTNTAIVVVTNSMANNDAANWLGELLHEAVLDNPVESDDIDIAKSSTKTSTELWARMSRYLKGNKLLIRHTTLLSKMLGRITT